MLKGREVIFMLGPEERYAPLAYKAYKFSQLDGTRLDRVAPRRASFYLPGCWGSFTNNVTPFPYRRPPLPGPNPPNLPLTFGIRLPLHYNAMTFLPLPLPFPAPPPSCKWYAYRELRMRRLRTAPCVGRITWTGWECYPRTTTRSRVSC